MPSHRAARLRLVSSIAVLAACSPTDTSSPSQSNVPADLCTARYFAAAPNPSFNAAGIFTASPIPVGQISLWAPLGNLNPNGHSYPSDHGGPLLRDATANSTPIYAAAGGRVIFLPQAGTGADRIAIRVDTSFVYAYGHVGALPGIMLGATVTAGQQIGSNNGASAGPDFIVYNYNLPPHYGIIDTCLRRAETGTDVALHYYSGALRDTLYGLVQVSGGATKDGTIEWDVAGALVGDWVLDGHLSMEAWQYQLSFAYDPANHQPLVTVGGVWPGGPLRYALAPDAPDFASVTAASGQVNYRLFQDPQTAPMQGLPQVALLAVQVLPNNQIKLQFFPGNMTGTATFDSGALIYNR